MTKFYTLVILSLIIISCSSGGKRKLNVPEGEPQWLYSPSSNCDQAKEICASGEGMSFSESDLHATKALASIFQTSIDAKFKFTKHSFSDNDISEMSEMVQNRVDENVKGILKASSIKERFERNEIKFSLAVLDKEKSSKVLAAEIKKINDQIKHYYSLKSRLYIKKLNILFNERELLNEKYIIMQNSRISSPVKFNDIAMLKFNSTGGERIKLNFSSEIPSLIKKKIEQSLTEVGYKIERKTNNDYQLDIKFKEKEEYLNVPGFKKYLFEISIKSKGKSGKRLGGHVISLVSDGRSKDDAFAKVREKIIKEFENNLEKLNLK